MTQLTDQKANLPVVNAMGFEKRELVLHSYLNCILRINSEYICQVRACIKYPLFLPHTSRKKEGKKPATKNKFEMDKENAPIFRAQRERERLADVIF